MIFLYVPALPIIGLFLIGIALCAYWGYLTYREK